MGLEDNYKIKSLEESPKKIPLLKADNNKRKIDIYLLDDVTVVNSSTNYTGILLRSKNNLYTPFFERVMSLGDHYQQHMDTIDFIDPTTVVEESVFYFVYNSGNYYHFVYDSLPYLITYRELKKNNLVKKLLIDNPIFCKLSPFFYEFLELLGIDKTELIPINTEVIYRKIYVSDSYTHGHDSNLPPRQEIYQLYEEMKEKVCKKVDISSYPKKIYISRRSWIHGDYSNIGTNYTQRRKLLIEDNLVKFLEKEGFTEVFTEKLSTQDKIGMMIGAEMVVGAIGGGLCNLLFANQSCKSICICSPYFLSINSRFLFSLSGGITTYFLSCFNTEDDRWKKWMRIKWEDKIGEIKEVHESHLIVNYSKTTLSGWNNEDKYEEIKVLKEEATELDKGLNSEWSFDLQEFVKFYRKIN